MKNLWDLRADPAALRRTAGGWRGLATAASGQAEAVDAAARRVYDGPWEGEAADSYNRHRIGLTDDIEETAGLADRVAAALEATAAALVSAQSTLTAALSAVTARWPADVSADSVIFRPQDPSDVAVDIWAIGWAIGQAVSTRAHLDGKLLRDKAEMAKAIARLTAIAAGWRSVAEGSTEPFTMPAEAPAAGTIYDLTNNQFIINTGTGGDKVEVRVDPATGQRTVVINGVEYQVPDGMAITIRAGAGNDTITVPAGTPINLTLLGGTGNDKITGGDGRERILAGAGTDTIKAGGGDDRVSGGADRDYIDGQGGDDTLTGGDGDDTIYGLSGNDHISGGDGRDYLEGATGNDTIHGEAGNDTISGGRDNDTIHGGAGNDFIYNGHGTDTVTGGTGKDTAYTQTGDTTDTEQAITIELKNLGTTIKFDKDATPEFIERVQADLDMLRSSPRGQLMLTEMDRMPIEMDRIHNDTLTIIETPDGNTARYRTIIETPDGNTARYRSNQIEYNPTRIKAADYRPPVVGFFHEKAHVYDYHHGTLADGRYNNSNDPDRMEDNGMVVGVPNSERQAVGLPIDADGDGDYEIDPDHPYDYTENGLRDEMGWWRRPKYGQ